MRRRACPLLLCLVIAIAGNASAQQQTRLPPRFATTRVTRAQIETYQAEVEAIPDIHCHEIWAHQRECSSKAQLTIWTFTLSGHPAHPAVSRGTMLVQPAGTGSLQDIDRSGHYAGDAAAFDAWTKELRAVDQKQVAVWRTIMKSK
jgi:hypothetical protein